MKKIFALLLVAILALSFAGCGETPQAPESEPAQEVLGSGILKDMESANNFDLLMEKYGAITLTAIGRGGGEYCVHLEEVDGGYRYFTSDATGVEYAVTPEGQFMVTSDGESQGLLFKSDEERDTLMVGAQDAVRGSLYHNNTTEQVVSQEEKDGKIVVTTKAHMTSEIDGYLEFKSAWGIDDEEFDFYNEYTLDKETLQMEENLGYCELSTGRIECGKAIYTYGQGYEMSDELKACMESTK